MATDDKTRSRVMPPAEAVRQHFAEKERALLNLYAVQAGNNSVYVIAVTLESAIYVWKKHFSKKECEEPDSIALIAHADRVLFDSYEGTS
jgi:hypothetical protein